MAVRTWRANRLWRSPAEPGLRAACQLAAVVREWLVLNIREWVGQMRDDLLANGKEPARQLRASWRREGLDTLVALIGGGTRRSALTAGRHGGSRSRLCAPDAWGTTESAAPTRSERLVRRHLVQPPAATERPCPFGLMTRGSLAEVIRVRSAGGATVVSADLKLAERERVQHTTRARHDDLQHSPQGAMGDHRGSGSQSTAKRAVTLIAEPRNPIQVSRRNHLDLGITWRQPDRDWELTLREDDVVCAIPGSHGRRSRPVLPSSLHTSAARRPTNRPFAGDEVSRRSPPDDLPVLLWNATGPTTRSDGKLIAANDQLRQIRSDDVANHILPISLVAEPGGGPQRAPPGRPQPGSA